MGIIQRQSLKYTLINFVGTFLGFLSVIFIYPLQEEAYATFQFVFNNASLLVPFLGLGIHGVIVKYFPVFHSKNAEHQFLFFTLKLSTLFASVLTFLIILLYFIFNTQLSLWFENFELIEANKFFILALAWLLLFNSNFIYHASTKLRIVIPDLISTIGIKIFLPILVLALYFDWIAVNIFMYWIIGFYFLVGIFLFFYSWSLAPHSTATDFGILDKGEYKGLVGFMLFAALNSLGISLVLKLDVLMIGSMLTKRDLWLFTTVLVISNVMDIPMKALNQIASPVISNDWKTKSLNNIKSIYQKSSVYGIMIGVLLFGMIYVIWPDILALMPNDKNGVVRNLDPTLVQNIFICLGFAKLIDLATGLNSNIITYSEKYRVHMYMLLGLGLMNIILNYYLIYNIGILGAAIASLISWTTFNFIKYIYVKTKFGIGISFGVQTVLMLIGLSITTLVNNVPFDFHPVINIGMKSATVVLLYFSALWLYNPEGTFRKLTLNIIQTTLKSLKRT